MSRENKEKILNALKNKKLVKVISGIRNYDKQKTLDVAMAAELGGATAVDISDDEEIIKLVRAAVQLPLFVSSVEPEKLIRAQKLGADVLEIGNFESFYKEERMFTPREILSIVNEVRKSLNENVLLSCTVPSTLEVEGQIKLAKELLSLKVDIIQTEGFMGEVPASEREDEVYNDILKAASTLANTKALRKVVPVGNIITASGITPNTAPIAISMGASGIGVGNYISSMTYQASMTEKVKELVESLNVFAPQKSEVEKMLVSV